MAVLTTGVQKHFAILEHHYPLLFWILLTFFWAGFIINFCLCTQSSSTWPYLWKKKKSLVKLKPTQLFVSFRASSYSGTWLTSLTPSY